MNVTIDIKRFRESLRDNGFSEVEICLIKNLANEARVSPEPVAAKVTGERAIGWQLVTLFGGEQLPRWWSGSEWKISENGSRASISDANYETIGPPLVPAGECGECAKLRDVLAIQRASKDKAVAAVSEADARRRELNEIIHISPECNWETALSEIRVVVAEYHRRTAVMEELRVKLAKAEAAEPPPRDFEKGDEPDWDEQCRRDNRRFRRQMCELYGLPENTGWHGIIGHLTEPNPREVLAGPCHLPAGQWWLRQADGYVGMYECSCELVLGKGKMAIRAEPPEFPAPYPKMPHGPKPVVVAWRNKEGDVFWGSVSGENDSWVVEISSAIRYRTADCERVEVAAPKAPRVFRARHAKHGEADAVEFASGIVTIDGCAKVECRGDMDDEGWSEVAADCERVEGENGGGSST